MALRSFNCLLIFAAIYLFQIGAIPASQLEDGGVSRGQAVNVALPLNLQEPEFNSSVAPKHVEQEPNVDSSDAASPQEGIGVIEEQQAGSKQDPAQSTKQISPIKSSELLPTSTRAWISIPDLTRFEEQFDKTQLGILVEDPAVQPFFEAVKKQLQGVLDDKNFRIGVQFEDVIKVRTGEVCIAGVLQDLEGGQPARGSHGLVVLVDVTGNEEKAINVLSEINAELVKSSGGNLQQTEISGVEVTKFSAQNPKRIRKTRTIFQVTHGGWMLISDNEEIFRDILRRLIATDKINKMATLSQYPTFTKVMEETELFGTEAELSWFVDPFGYLQLAQKLYEEEQEVREHHDDWPRHLRDVGFDAVKGIGGNLALAVTAEEQELESLSRIFIYAPRDNLSEKHQRFFDLFDFNDGKPKATEPHDLVSNNTGGFFGGSWEFTKLLNSIGYVYDSVTGEEGGFKRLLVDFKNEPDFQVDIPRMVGMMNNQLFVFSTTEKPIDATSERAAVGIPLNPDADAKNIMDSLKRMAKGSVDINLAGKRVIEVDTTIEVDEMDDFDLPPGIDDGFEDDLDDDQQKPKRFSLFEKRYMVVHNGILIIANDKQYVRQLIGAAPAKKLNEAEDYLRVKAALEGLTDSEKVRFRRFVRLDRVLEVNYRILREGGMAGSATMLGRLLNKFYESDSQKATEQRKQNLDGSTLPADYQNKIAPFLGPTGWVTEVEDHGWRVTGCLLKK